MNPDIQFFPASGTWVKPAGAVRVDIVVKGGDGGNATEWSGGEGGGATGICPMPVPASGASAASRPGDGRRGRLGVLSFDAADLPDTVEVTVGKGGRPGGRDGYALIVTHLAEEAAP